MPKQGKARVILLLVFFLILILVLFNLAYSRYGAFWKTAFKKKAPSVPVVVSYPSPAPKINPASLPLMVDKENLNTAKLVSLDYGREDLGFYLPQGSFFYAGTDGVIRIYGNQPQQIIDISSTGGRERVRYIFSGEALFENGKEVKRGEAVGKAAKAPLPTRDVNLIIQFNQDNRPFSFTQEIIESWQ